MDGWMNGGWRMSWRIRSVAGKWVGNKYVDKRVVG